MQTTYTDPGNLFNIENSFYYQDEERINNEIQMLIEQLDGARKTLKGIHQQKLSETQKEMQQENNFCESLENSDLLNSKEIKITYFASKQIELLLTALYEKIELLNAKLRVSQNNLEKQIYNITNQLSKERLKQPTNLKTIQQLKAQLNQKKKQLKQKYEQINNHINEMLKSVGNEEEDDDVNFVN